MDTLETKTIKARKPHRCGLCNGVIEKNMQYVNQTNVYSGQIYHFKTHCHCSFLAIHYDMYRDCDDEGLTSDVFFDHIYEIFNDGFGLIEKSKIIFNELHNLEI